MAEDGFLSGHNGSQAREVLLDVEAFEELRAAGVSRGTMRETIAHRIVDFGDRRRSVTTTTVLYRSTYMPARFLIYVLLIFAAVSFGFLRRAGAAWIISDTLHFWSAGLTVVLSLLLEVAYWQAIDDLADAVVQRQRRAG